MSLLPLPENLGSLLSRPRTNASLFFDRGFDGFKRAGSRLEIPPGEKLDFLARFSTRPRTDLAGLRDRRRQALEALGARPLVLFTQSRLVIGLGLPSSLETGFLLDRLTGWPYLPGSSLKGLARAAAVDASHGEPGEQRTFWERNLARIFGPTTDEGSAQGTVAFFDAFPQGDIRFEVDVLTPHHGEYYGNPEKEKPGDWENPTPVAFLTVAAGCAFEIFLACAGSVRRRQEGDLERVLEILKAGLSDLGIGGKRAAGYGWFGESAPLAERRRTAAAPPLREQHPREPRRKDPDPRPGGDPPPKSGRLGAMAAAFEKARGQETGDGSPKKRSR